jgi:hypothetical protein
MRPVGNRVSGHCDWRVEHVRFLANPPVVAFDWDILCSEREPALIGVVANGFCADWSQGDNRQVPRLDEARGFVRDYERARGKMFSPEERRLCGACLAYASAYTARCGPAGGRDKRQVPSNISFGASAVILSSCRPWTQGSRTGADHWAHSVQRTCWHDNTRRYH